MKWRVMVEVTDENGSMTHSTVATGERAGPGHTADTLGLTLGEGKQTLAGLQRLVVRAQVAEHCRARRRCGHCGRFRALKDHRPRRLTSLFGTVEVRVPRLKPCRCGVACRRSTSPAAEVMPDRCTPEYERVLAMMGSALSYRRAQALLAELLPLDDGGPDVETIRQRTLAVGARLERLALVAPAPPDGVTTDALVLSVDGGHVSSVKTYQTRSFEVLIARAGRADDRDEELVFSSMPAEADRQVEQLRHLLVDRGATANTPVTILSDGAEGPRHLGERASPGPVRHVLDWFHLSMRVQHVAQAVVGWATVASADQERTAELAPAVERVRWRLWHGQVDRALALIGEILIQLTASLTSDRPPSEQRSVRKATKLLCALEIYVAGHAWMIIDYASARRRGEPISTATTESTVQRLLHRRCSVPGELGHPVLECSAA